MNAEFLNGAGQAKMLIFPSIYKKKSIIWSLDSNHINKYLSTDYFGPRLIIFDNNMNTTIFCSRSEGRFHVLYFYSIHVIAEYNLSCSEIICQQINMGKYFVNDQLWGKNMEGTCGEKKIE